MLYDKKFYHTSLNELKNFVKLNKYCNELGIYTSNLSRFLKDDYHDECMSLENLELLYAAIITDFSKYVM